MTARIRLFDLFINKESKHHSLQPEHFGSKFSREPQGSHWWLEDIVAISLEIMEEDESP